MKKMNKDGYSLIELMVAIAITAIVMTCILAIMNYTTRSMSQTQEKVNLQNEAKDAINHLSTYAEESSALNWDAGRQLLTLTKETAQQKTGTIPAGDPTVESKKEKYYYWSSGGKLYFASEAEGVSESSLPVDEKHVLAENVLSFTCEEKEVGAGAGSSPGASPLPSLAPVKKQKILHVEMKMESSQKNAQYDSVNDIYLRNQNVSIPEAASSAAPGTTAP